MLELCLFQSLLYATFTVVRGDPLRQYLSVFLNSSLFGITYSIHNAKSLLISKVMVMKCCTIARQYAIMMLGNMLKICLVFGNPSIDMLIKVMLKK